MNRDHGHPRQPWETLALIAMLVVGLTWALTVACEAMTLRGINPFSTFRYLTANHRQLSAWPPIGQAAFAGYDVAGLSALLLGCLAWVHSRSGRWALAAATLAGRFVGGDVRRMESLNAWRKQVPLNH